MTRPGDIDAIRAARGEPAGRSLYLFILVVLAGMASCGGSSWDKAVARANESKKPLIVEFYATWCKPCARFERTVLDKPDVRAALEDVEFHRYDFDSTAGKHHARRLGVRSVPTIIAVGRDGKPIAALRGAVARVKFLEFLDLAHHLVYGGAPQADGRKP